MFFQYLFQEVFKRTQASAFYYVSLIFIQKLPNNTQKSDPKSLLCRPKIKISQGSLLGVHYVILKKKDEQAHNLKEFKKTSYLQDVPGKIILLLVLEGVLRKCHSIYCVGKMHLYKSSFLSLQKFQIVLQSYY